MHLTQMPNSLNRLNEFIQKWMDSPLFYYFFFILAIIFTPLRLFSDSSYYITHVLMKNSFHLEHLRIVLLPDELWVRMGVYFHFPVFLLLLIFSLTPLFWFIFLEKLAHYFNPDYHWKKMWIGVWFVGYAHGFFCPHFEGYYALAFGLFAIQISLSQHMTVWGFILFSIAYSFSLLGHPQVGLVVLVIFGWQHLHQPWTPKTFLLIGILSIIWIGNILLKKIYITSYEMEKMKAMGIEHIKADYIVQILKILFTYGVEFTIAIGTVVYTVWKKRKKEALAFVLCALGFAFLFYHSHRYYGWNRYNEQVFFSWCYIAWFMVIYFYAENPVRFSFVLTFIFLFWLVKFSISTSYFIERQFIMHQFIQETQAHSGEKFYLPSHRITKPTNVDWSYSIETFLISSAFYSKTVTIIPEEDWKSSIGENSLEDRYIFRVNEVFELDSLNPVYFHWKKEPYTVLE